MILETYTTSLSLEKGNFKMIKQILITLLVLAIIQAFGWTIKNLREIRGEAKASKKPRKKPYLTNLTAEQRELVKAIKILEKHDEGLSSDILEVVYQRATHKRSLINDQEDDGEVDKHGKH